ncbi:YqaJ viral recombinase family protein [Herbaspirillum sp. WGmk3]|uniref:YqaJ viral recombinase family nuclease n=1 Tax=Herbaspirillum sp. WGmk3 TaxID=2919925 RepID=UPI0020903812|nr:YqaJ viral recombinase family protein [Herbaspirillum sp. WGmk3]MCO4856051.1 YqaJ viral recombinase family protein [Herbaspirillum sp. WGmk3]
MSFTTVPLTRRAGRAALRLVKTHDLSREEWLSIRRRGIGSSDAAAAIGLNPHQSMLELWMIKTGRSQMLPQQDPRDRTSPTYWGSLLEPIVAAHYTHETGNKVRKINAVLQHPDPDKTWMLANIDREILGAPDVQILECKTAGEYGARAWREGVPEYVQCQVQHQLAVTGKAAADVCVLICGQEIRIHRIERDEELIDGLIKLEREFWNYVETDTQPPADGSESADRALRSLYPHDYGDVADFRDNRPMSAVFADLQAIREEIATRDKVEQQLKQTIQQMMGSSSRALFETGSVSWKRSKDGAQLDTDRLQADHPDLVKSYLSPKAGSRRFLIQP